MPPEFEGPYYDHTLEVASNQYKLGIDFLMCKASAAVTPVWASCRTIFFGGDLSTKNRKCLIIETV